MGSVNVVAMTPCSVDVKAFASIHEIHDALDYASIYYLATVTRSLDVDLAY